MNLLEHEQEREDLKSFQRRKNVIYKGLGNLMTSDFS